MFPHIGHFKQWIFLYLDHLTKLNIKRELVYESCHIEVAIPRAWHCYPGPILCAAPHAVTGSGQLLCRDQAGSMERKGSLSTIWWSKTLGGLILGHKFLCHHMTGTWPNGIFPLLTVLLKPHVRYVGMSLDMHSWPFKIHSQWSSQNNLYRT